MRNQGFYEGQPLNIPSNKQFSPQATRQNLGSAQPGGRNINASLNDSLLTGAATVGDNPTAIDEAALKT